ncbi:MAG: urease accessory protein UreD [Acidimicrobiales bacterium]
MIARARLVADVAPDGGTRIITARSDAPLALRITPTGVYMVGSAAGPLGGDDLALDVEVRSGADLTVRTSAASVALPGNGPSRVRVTASVGKGGRLQWLPEPTVAAAGCDHHVQCRVELDGDALLVWREEIVLGRHDEAAGSIEAGLYVDLDGTPLLRQNLGLGPGHSGWDGPAVIGSYRAVGSTLVVGPAIAGASSKATEAFLSETAAVMALAGPAVHVTALAPEALTLRRQLDAGLDWLVAAISARASESALVRAEE